MSDEQPSESTRFLSIEEYNKLAVSIVAPKLLELEDRTKEIKDSIKPEFVEKHYAMDWQKEFLIFDGYGLADGMKVIIEDSSLRVPITPKALGYPAIRHRAMKMNRWMTISKKQIREDKCCGPLVEFVGTYDDGSQMKHTWPVEYSWLSNRESNQERNAERLRIYALVMEAIGWKDEVKLHGVINPTQEHAEIMGTEITDRILKVNHASSDSE